MVSVIIHNASLNTIDIHSRLHEQKKYKKKKRKKKKTMSQKKAENRREHRAKQAVQRGNVGIKFLKNASHLAFVHAVDVNP